TDPTFGIEVAYFKAPEKGKFNLSPAQGMQFFGEVEIDSKTRALTVTLRDLKGTNLYSKRLDRIS
ncbi:MAG: alkaline phosphatase, partial [Acidobacteria bacterium]|nr:alkaline phosphatase [Acidobacteriota bacterium]